MPQEPSVFNRSATIGATNVVVAEQQNAGTRTFIAFVNTSTAGQGIYLSVGEEAAVGKGFYMAPGGFFSESTDGITYPSQKHYCAIATAAGGTLSIQERTITGGGL